MQRVALLPALTVGPRPSTQPRWAGQGLSTVSREVQEMDLEMYAFTKVDLR